jgi:signal transduction histidine kinase
VHADVEVEDSILRLAIEDDGVGGADRARGSGLVGLSDRVEALGGRIEIASPVGRGTSLLVRIPIEGD